MSDVTLDELHLNPENQDPPEGWYGEEPPETEAEEKLPFATEQLLNAADLLEKGENEQLSLPEIMEAQASALTSIAASVHDLTALLEEELAWRRSQRPVQGTDVEEDEDTASAKKKSAHRSLGPTEDPDFSYTGR